MTVREYLKSEAERYDQELQELSAAQEGRSLVEFMGEWNDRAHTSNFLVIQAARKAFYMTCQWLVELPSEVLEAEIKC